MRIVVQKYGGSSVSSLEKLEIIAQRLVKKTAEGWRVVVVVSAMGNATDELLTLARQIAPDPPARELDMLLSTGERTTMSLLSIAIQKYGAKAISFTGSQSGIVTNHSHAHAKIISVRPYRIQDELERGKIVIVAGYQGTSYKNEITTLGRGGSDMTAIALAGALQADACEIYSDVDGIYTADPKIVLDAKKIDELSATEMLQMAVHGAKVLHAEAIAYAQNHGIALYAKSSAKAHEKGSFIRPDHWPDHALEKAKTKITALSTAKQLLTVHVASPRGLPQLLSAIKPYEDRAKMLITSQSDTECFAVLDTWNCPSQEDLTQQIENNVEAKIHCRQDCLNITLVGQGIGSEMAIIQAALDTLAKKSIPWEYVDIQNHAITFIVTKDKVALASQALHELIP